MHIFTPLTLSPLLLYALSLLTHPLLLSLCVTPVPHPDIAREPDGRFVLEDGTTLQGYSFGARRSVAGEVVFNTGPVLLRALKQP